MIESLIEMLPGLLFGALAAELVGVIIKLIKFLPTFFDKNTHKSILGSWEIYVCVRESNGKFTITNTAIKISIDPLRQYRVHADDINGAHYHGSATRDAGNIAILIRTKDRKYPDITCHKISLMPLDEYNTLIGTFVSTDYRQRVCGGISVLSRTKTTDEEIRKIIKNNFAFSPNKDAMSVR